MDLQVIISPAKKMRRAGAGTAADDVVPAGIPPFPREAARLAGTLKAMGKPELQALWKTSDKLTAESLEATRELVVPQSFEEALTPPLVSRLTPALLTYDGIQYRSMAPEVLEAGALAWLQGHLSIVSALHGRVRPLDAVMPYRLEMGARLSVDGSKDLYGFWGDRIARAIVEGAAVPEDVCVVNLASVEYAKAVTPHLGETPCVTCVFGEALRNSKPVQRSTASKAARGSMVCWMAERALDDVVDLRAFDVGYRFDEALSTSDRLVFMHA